jgi:hypothetical protein
MREKNVPARALLIVGGSSLAIIAALVLGVGLGSHLVLRHIVQTLPLWVAATLSFRRSPAAGWAALPLFSFWLALMVFIWLYLLGIATLVSGHFTLLEIAMTIIVGMASAAGIWAFIRLRSFVAAWRATALFLIFAGLQLACFRVSLLPMVAHR